MPSLVAVLILLAEPNFCAEKPNEAAAASHGRPSRGSVDGAAQLTESAAVRVLPKRHRGRCLTWGTPRLVEALAAAGAAVQAAVPDSPALGVGNLGRPRGGSLAPYSKSHQAGRDADLAFYATDAKGQPMALDDLEHFGGDLRSRDSSLRFDVRRNWALVAALLSDARIEVKWLFVSEELKQALLTEGRRQGAAPALLRRAAEVLHQPSDAPPHDDHFHLRIRCTATERAADCRD
ncbi:MAG: penicillin-insensitive murein endopeptidase [Myxococcota bacterium]